MTCAPACSTAADGVDPEGLDDRAEVGALMPATVLAGRPTGEPPALLVDPGRLAEEDRRFVEKAGTDGLGFGDGLAEGNEIDDITLERHHRAEGLLVHGADGPQPEAGGQHAVVRGRRSASLDVPQNGHPRLVARALFERVGHDLADPSELS